MNRVLLIVLVALTSQAAVAQGAAQQARASAALFRFMDDKFNSAERPCEAFIPGFMGEFARSKVSQEPGYSRMREIGAEELAKLFGPALQAGETLVDGTDTVVIDADTAAKVNESRAKARAYFSSLRALPVDEQSCRNFLKMLP